MIQIGDLILDLSDPVILLALVLGGLVFVLLVMSLYVRPSRCVTLSEPLVYQLAHGGTTGAEPQRWSGTAVRWPDPCVRGTGAEPDRDAATG